MLAARLRGLRFPRSLRRQFVLALSVLALVMVAGSLTAISALRRSAGASRLLAERRLDRMQDAQDLVLLTLLIERETLRVREAESLDGLRSKHGGIIERLGALDRLVKRLGAAADDVAVLALHRSSQVFRSTTDVVVQLLEDQLLASAAFDRSLQERTGPLLGTADPGAVSLAVLLYRLRDEVRLDRIEDLRGQFVRQAGAARLLPPAVRDDLAALRAGAVGADGDARADPFSRRLRLVERREALGRFNGELQRQAEAMLASAQDLSAHLTSDYREAVRRLAETSGRDQRWVLALLAGSLVLAWAVFRFALGTQVLARLQEVSRSLRTGDGGTGPPQVRVRGEDEIAEMARAVERLLEDRRRLAEANEELESFSYSVSHDLRAPLRHVDGFVGLLRERTSGRLDAQAQHYMDAIAGAATRMGALIDALLSFLHMRHVELLPAPVDAAALVREVVAELGPSTADRAIDWKLGELPTVQADRQMLRLVIGQLLSNAVKFTRPRPRAVIEVGRTQSSGGAEVVLFVRDNGVGFDMKYADKLFKVFQRLHASDDYGGTGIGLANVRRIVERHGGRAWAEGAPGQGATFYFSLPSQAGRP